MARHPRYPMTLNTTQNHIIPHTHHRYHHHSLPVRASSSNPPSHPPPTAFGPLQPARPSTCKPLKPRPRSYSNRCGTWLTFTCPPIPHHVLRSLCHLRLLLLSPPTATTLCPSPACR